VRNCPRLNADSISAGSRSRKEIFGFEPCSKYSQMKLQVKREALAKLNRKANDSGKGVRHPVESKYRNS
jgi:hypothetical protein